MTKDEKVLEDRIKTLREALSEIQYATDEQNTAGYCARILKEDLAKEVAHK
jgi:hypothetical protein